MAKPSTQPSNQKNLFSFFSKKSKPTVAPRDRVAPVINNPPLQTRIQVYWPKDDEWYACVLSKQLNDGRVKLVYEDGEVEVVRLEKEKWRLADAANDANANNEEDNDDDESKAADANESNKRENTDQATTSKRRRIHESSDESFAMDEDDEDDSFQCDVDDSDDESFKEEEPSKPKPKVTLLTPKPSASSQQPKRIISSTPHKPPRPTPANLPSKQLSASLISNNSPSLPIANIVNLPQTHFHNHLTFFSDRIDLSGHPASSPHHSPYNMKIDWDELSSLSSSLGTSLSPAQKQWWDIKSHYANCVLLFKTGKFYEMFHDDADVAVKELNFVYMKGVLAHAGFPEGAYDKIVGTLVERGYRVARVEQTETPEMLKERKRGMKGGKKPMVVCREVCGVVSLGTRTFCYLDDVTSLENDGKSSNGPLLVIKETLHTNAMDTDTDSTTQSTCEYGITAVDPITATITLGQFADDQLHSRLQTLLTNFTPSEIIFESGENGASPTLLGLLKSCCPKATIRPLGINDTFPTSFAVKEEDQRAIERKRKRCNPWSGEEAMEEVHRRGYYPRGSKNSQDSTDRWPEVLKACVEGGAELALSSFAAALYYLQSHLVDEEILGMGIVKAYVPPNGGASQTTPLEDIYQREARHEGGVDLMENDPAYLAEEATIDHLALDGTTLNNLEILHNLSSGSSKGSLLSKIDFTKSPHGSRLLRAWLLRPLFIKSEIDRRADAVSELSSGAAAMAMGEARDLLKKTGDIERLLTRVHSMGGGGDGRGSHPDDRAIFYENEKHNRRKVGDFSKLLNGLKAAAHIPEKFDGVSVVSPLLAKIVRTTDDGGCMPADLHAKLDWFFENFDLKKAAKGEFEPSPGMSEDYDNACEAIESITRELDAVKNRMSQEIGRGAKKDWKYINTKEDAKDKYLIELPATIPVPPDFEVKGKRGKGSSQINKYRCEEVASLVEELERAIDIKKEGKALGMKMVFAKFDSMRETWKAAAMATAMLDAIGSLATLAGQPGFCRPTIVECPPNKKPGIKVVQGRHPCVEVTHIGGSFIPNDLVLGGNIDGSDASNEASILLLSGPNMGGKSTLLRQTCLMTILAQIGSFVPAEECSLTPVDRIFTRLGASDRILCGQSTFFVELAETAAAVRGATRRSLVIMDELGRGTSTFDGTAIASATVKHLVERSKCLTMFATHYHSLLEDWKDHGAIRLGHMECIAEEDSSDDVIDKSSITFLYTLGDGPCPKSFGVNVARLAGLPDDVLCRAKNVSAAFEAEMNGEANHHKIIPSTAISAVAEVQKSFSGDCITSLDKLQELWKSLQ